MALQAGDILEGKVTGIKPFGAFVALPESKTGLVHISEVSYEFVQDLTAVLEVGRTAKLRCPSSARSPRRSVPRVLRAPRVRTAPPVRAAPVLPRRRRRPACGSPSRFSLRAR